MQILFSAHALPQKFIDRGDPYLEHVLDNVKGVMAAGRRASLACRLPEPQRAGASGWSRRTVEVLDSWPPTGTEAVLMVPISFVSDHIETLHEIDIEYRDHAQRQGIRLFRRAPSLNDDAGLFAAMAELVRRYLAADDENL